MSKKKQIKKLNVQLNRLIEENKQLKEGNLKLIYDMVEIVNNPLSMKSMEIKYQLKIAKDIEKNLWFGSIMPKQYRSGIYPKTL